MWHESYRIPFKSTPYEFHLHGFCDTQLGNDSTSIQTIRNRIREIIEDPYDSGIIIPGDIEDEDRPSTRSIRRAAFAEREEVIYRDAQKHMAWLDKEVIPLLLPLQKTKYGIMGILAGHHWTQLSPVLNSVQYICQELTRLSGKKVPYMGIMSAFLDLTFYRDNGKDVKQSIYLSGHIQHGEGGGQTKASALTKLDRAAQGFYADFYWRAHDTQLIATKTDQIRPQVKIKTINDEPHMLHRTIPYINCGAATRGYLMDKNHLSYIEDKMMRPTTLGWPTQKFKIRKAYKEEDPNQNLICEMKVEI